MNFSFINNQISTKWYDLKERFKIVPLSGSLILDKKEINRNIFCGLNVTLSSDGSVFGGQVVDVLIDASPV